MKRVFQKSEVAQLEDRLNKLAEIAWPSEKRAEIVQLEKAVSSPDFWSNPTDALRVASILSERKRLLDQFNEAQSKLSDAKVLRELGEQENDESAVSESSDIFQLVDDLVTELEIIGLLSGQFDRESALVSIRSGAGGDDATDFAQMLMQMYLRYADRRGTKATVLEVSQAEGAGIKSGTIKLEAPYAYGLISVESGTHRLVRMSPFNSAGKRQTSFAAVEVVPLFESSDDIEIPDSEVRVDVFRSSGPGGQSVNTTDSAVRITHLPTGTVVTCQNEKSQLQNKIEAMRVLQSRLLAARRMEVDAMSRRLAGDVKASWGEQMRSYVLAPYRMVKDHRTNHEENNPDDVFGGKIEGFISAGITWRAKQNR